MWHCFFPCLLNKHHMVVYVHLPSANIRTGETTRWRFVFNIGHAHSHDPHRLDFLVALFPQLSLEGFVTSVTTGCFGRTTAVFQWSGWTDQHNPPIFESNKFLTLSVINIGVVILQRQNEIKGVGKIILISFLFSTGRTFTNSLIN